MTRWPWLPDLYERHFENPARKRNVAISLGACEQLLEEVERRWSVVPTRILEFGSGLSTAVLRRYAELSGGTVFTAENELLWLGHTAGELAREGLINGLLLGHEVFMRILPHGLSGPYDFVFLDMAPGTERFPTLQALTPYLARHCTVVIDDWHKVDRWGPVGAWEDWAEAERFRITPTPEKADRWGRYMAVARRDP